MIRYAISIYLIAFDFSFASFVLQQSLKANVKAKSLVLHCTRRNLHFNIRSDVIVLV